MKRFFLCLVVALTTFSTVFARNKSQVENASVSVAPVRQDSLRIQHLNDVLIIGNHAEKTTPVAQTNLEAKDIQALTLANYLPHVLWMTPSLVATSENGTGGGYSALRIRGSDASRINVTLNGIPLNNPESQEMYWVDVPDLSSALQHIQVQRGVGTSTNGPGAFGASINMTSRVSGEKPYAELATTAGSYRTFQQNIAYGTGLFGNGYSLDLRYSNLTSDGYIRNGWTKHQSLFASLTKRFKKSVFRFNYIFGEERTGITWEGPTDDQMNGDLTFNPAGEIKEGVYYDNESDNYWQHHFQAFYTQELSSRLLLSAGLNYTDGFGYYEQYKQDKKFSSMGIANQTIKDSTYKTTDLVRRKNMANGFYTGNVNLKYSTNKLNVQGGGMYTYFQGDHYANLIWVEHNENIADHYEWVRNHAEKTDVNAFIKTEYLLTKGLNAYVDLQYRYVDYKMSGTDDDDMVDLTQHRTWHFFNPKAGLFFQLSPLQKMFASVAVANREPARADLKDSHKFGVTLDAENLTDYEVGYTFDNQKLMLSANVYYMNYKNQLVPTGQLNDVGYKLMNNVDKSYRAGIELQAGFVPCRWLQLDANTTLSRNRAFDYTVYYTTYNNSDDWDEVDVRDSKYIEEASLPFSPEWIAAGSVTIIPAKNFKLNVTEKYVGEQYVTNTQNEDLKLPAYHCANATLTYDFQIRGFANAQIGLTVNNLYSNQYFCNAWGGEYHFANGEPTVTEKGLYVVAPRNYLAKFTVKF
jgi:iron complex outermembrane recepter protein